jgi:uncharacterized protein YdcH (DUF465 family)
MSAVSNSQGVVRIALIIAAFAAVFTTAILYFQQQTTVAEFVACNKIDDAIKEANAAYEAAVNAELDVYKNQKKAIDDELMACLNTPKADPCADLQKAFDEAAKNFNSIQSPNVQMPGADLEYGSANYNNAWNAYKNAWDNYYKARDEAYAKYKPIRDALFQCRKDNPPKDVPYEQSDSKKCYDDYDAELKTIRDTFDSDTVALRAARDALIKALEARRKACFPPKDSFTTPPGGSTGGSDEETTGGTTTPPVELVNCQPLPEPDSELSSLKGKAAELTAELQEIDNSIDNANKRIKKLESELSKVSTSTPTYIDGPRKGQIITNLAEAQAARGVIAKDIGDQIEFLRSYINRKKEDKPNLQSELDEVTEKITARETYIKKENEARQRAFPTKIHISKPDKCEYFHCHGTLCGKKDPAPDSCGHGATTEDDKECKKFFDSYLKAAGVK